MKTFLEEFWGTFPAKICIVALFVLGCTGCTPPFCGWTPPIETPNGVSTLEAVELGGMDQWIQVRGTDAALPVLLFLHGGPGAAQIPVAHHFNGDLENDFVVVNWDQRGAGKSNPPDFDENSMTLERFVLDAHELTQLLEERVGVEKIYLAGHSWGTRMGVEVIRRWPEDYHAYIGIGQVVHALRAEEISYQFVMDEARARGNPEAIAELEGIGPPPWSDKEDFGTQRYWLQAFGGNMDVEMTELLPIALAAPEYCLWDYIRWFDGNERGSGPMWEGYWDTDLFEEAPRLEVPVFFFAGRQDFNTPGTLVEEYCAALEAPMGKALVWFEASAHTPNFNEPEAFAQRMIEIRDETLP